MKNQKGETVCQTAKQPHHPKWDRHLADSSDTPEDKATNEQAKPDDYANDRHREEVP